MEDQNNLENNSSEIICRSILLLFIETADTFQIETLINYGIGQKFFCKI